MKHGSDDTGVELGTLPPLLDPGHTKGTEGS
jgi:hypothetical protein